MAARGYGYGYRSRNWESTESAANRRDERTRRRGQLCRRDSIPKADAHCTKRSSNKKANEGWADFADDALADKGYPTLQEEAREQLAINAFLQQLTQPQIAFSVKQKRPKTLDDAVAATLEMESYLAGPSPVGIASSAENLPVCPVSALSQVDKLTQAVEQLTERVERAHAHEEPLLGSAGHVDSLATWHATAPKPAPHTRETSHLQRHGPIAGG